MRNTAPAASHALPPAPAHASRDRHLFAVIIMGAALAMLAANGPGVVWGDAAWAHNVWLEALVLNAALMSLALARYGRAELAARAAPDADAPRPPRAAQDIDPLTGCLSRSALAALTDTMAAAASARGDTLGVLLVDLGVVDHTNKTLGPEAGDALLIDAARRIGGVIPPDARLVRLGGEAFACLTGFAPHQAERIEALAAAMLHALASLPAMGSGPGAAIGLARADRSGAPLMRHAEIAAYHARKHRPGGPVWFEATMESELRYRHEIEAGIRQGLAQREFVPYYEQQIDLDSGRIVGFEMLARWHSPSFGLIGPEVFVPIAEEMGVIGALSEMVIEQALEDARAWDPSLTLSVNISPLQLRDPWFAQRLLRMMVAANFPPQRLDIEITETSLHQNLAGVHTLVTSLKNQGVSLSLDDFGTGYSSLAQLRNLPFDRIKIDRSFISAIHHDDESMTIVESILSLGRGLGLPVTAEGIENEAVLERLRALGSLKGQGWLYGRPMPAQEIHTLLQSHSLLLARHGDAGQGDAGQPDTSQADADRQAAPATQRQRA